MTIATLIQTGNINGLNKLISTQPSLINALTNVDLSDQCVIQHSGLHLAVVHNQLEIIKLLLNNGANPNLKERGPTAGQCALSLEPLSELLEENNLTRVPQQNLTHDRFFSRQYLFQALDNKAECPISRQPLHEQKLELLPVLYTPVELAARTNNIDAFACLTKGFKVQWEQVLAIAILFKSDAILNYAKTQLGNDKLCYTLNSLKVAGVPLYLALPEAKMYDEACELLKHFKDSQYLDGNTPLSLAILSNDGTFLQKVLEFDRNTDVQLLSGETPKSLSLAGLNEGSVDEINRKIMPLTTLLSLEDIASALDFGKIENMLRDNANEEGGSLRYSPLSYLFSNNHVDLAKVFLCKYDINEIKYYRDNQTTLSYTPLLTAVSCSDVLPETLDALLDTPNLDINKTNHKGYTPLMYACSRQIDWRIEQLLQRPGIEINALNKDGQSALFIAVYFDLALSTIKQLINYGSDVNLSPQHIENPLTLAIKNENLEVIDLLLHHGAKVGNSARKGHIDPSSAAKPLKDHILNIVETKIEEASSKKFRKKLTKRFLAEKSYAAIFKTLYPRANFSKALRKVQQIASAPLTSQQIAIIDVAAPTAPSRSWLPRLLRPASDNA